MSDEVKLEAMDVCLFCKNTELTLGDTMLGTGYVFCNNCGACGPQKETPAEAIAAWNRRAAPAQDAKVAALVEACNSAAIVLETAIAPDDAFMQKNAPMSATIFREVAAKLRTALAALGREEMPNDCTCDPAKKHATPGGVWYDEKCPKCAPEWAEIKARFAEPMPGEVHGNYDLEGEQE